MSDELQLGRHTVRLTHPERVLFPEDGVTKGDLARYYAEIGDAIVPHLRDRPFTHSRVDCGGGRFPQNQPSTTRPWASGQSGTLAQATVLARGR